MGKPLLIFIAAAVAGSCAANASRFDRGAVGAGIETRTGFGVGPENLGGEAFLPPDVDPVDGLTEDEAVAIALWNNRGFQEALADLGIARADLIEAGLLRNPVLSLLFPLGPKQFEATAKLPFEALWLAPRRVMLAGIEGERVASRLIQHGLDLIRDVKLACGGQLLATARLDVAHEAVSARTSIAALVRRRFDGGDASSIDVVLANTDMRLAEEVVEERRHAVVLGHQRLLALLGLDVQKWKTGLSGALAAPAPLGESSPQTLVAEAIAARPDVRAAELSLKAVEERMGLADDEHVGASLIGDANAEGTNGFEAGPGLELTIPIFHQNQGAKARTAAERDKALLHLETVRQGITAEVQEAWTRWLHADARLARFEEHVMPELSRAEELARASFAAGETTMLPLLEATARSIDARDRRAILVGELRAAQAELERSVGRRLSPRLSSDSAGAEAR